MGGNTTIIRVDLMRTVNVYAAKTHLSRLLDAVVAGEEIIIAWAGKPLANLVAYNAVTQPRELGYWRGKVHIAEDFDGLPDPIAAAFRGEMP
jgi:prevent-host-death family protein